MDESSKRKQFAAAVRIGAKTLLGDADEKVWIIRNERISSNRLAEMIENGEDAGIEFFRKREAKLAARGVSFEESLKPLLRMN